jgi:hypothetical protein
MDKPMGHGGVGSGSLRIRGLTVEALDEWTPMIIWHVPAMVLLCSGNETLVRDIFKPLDLREVMKNLTLRPLWLG